MIDRQAAEEKCPFGRRHHHIALREAIRLGAVSKEQGRAIMLHTVLDYGYSLPVYVHMTDGHKYDMTVAKQLGFPSGSVVVMDRAYMDFAWFYNLDSSGGTKKRTYFMTKMCANCVQIKKHLCVALT